MRTTQKRSRMFKDIYKGIIKQIANEHGKTHTNYSKCTKCYVAFSTLAILEKGSAKSNGRDQLKYSVKEQSH